MSAAACERVDLPVSGMTCAACARAIERTLAGTPGVESSRVNLATNTATVEYDPARARVQRDQRIAVIVRPGEHQIEFAAIELALNRLDLGVEIRFHGYIAQFDQFGGIAPALCQGLPALYQRAQFGKFFHHRLRCGRIIPEIGLAGSPL